MSKQLTEAQRYENYLGLKRKWSRGSAPADEIGVSKSIYNHVHADPAGRLAPHLPHKLKYTRRFKALRPTKATNIANRTSIHLKPQETDGKRFGDWETDTIVDSCGHAILTLMERSTNFLVMEKLPQGRKAAPLAKAVARLLFPYRNNLHTITTDSGCEFVALLEITRRLGMKGRGKVIVYSPIHTAHGRRGLVKTQTSSSESTFPRK